MINKRLFEHYGIDTNKDLNIRKRCPRPFDTVLIDKQGSLHKILLKIGFVEMS